MNARHAASLAQIRASHPGRSTWLAANAGSGKTRVLTDRVARLLLAGTEPQRILCLTYTTAAASEMQNRLFQTLGAWAMRPDDELRSDLANLGEEGDLSAASLAAARRLFARAIETPGGLKIQTIHSFCASLLRRFPLEAGVPPGFAEMDGRSAELLRQEVLENMADGADVEAVDALTRLGGDERVESILAGICGHAPEFAAPLDPEAALAAVGLPPGFDSDRLLAEVALGDEGSLFAQLVPLLLSSSPRDVAAGQKLSALQGRALRPDDLGVLESVLLFGEKAEKSGPFSARIGSFPTASLSKGAAAGLMPALEALMARVEAARPRRLALDSARRIAALHRFAAGFLPRYAERKMTRGMLDFDDLVLRAAALLDDRSVAQWVLFRLDGGLDHILVDEAQDTSPAQWRVIERLAEEFTAGEGARPGARTVFVVGDKKQSIYSFQGADLAAFDQMRDVFEARQAKIGQPLQSLSLDYSFRSSAAILRLVDMTFDERVRRSLGGAPKHIAYAAAKPGRVDLWAAIEPPPKGAEPDGADGPDDRLPAKSVSLQLAEKIASEIRGMIEAGTTIHTRDGVRPIHEGDVIILVRRRSALFGQIIRACKAAGLAVAGADRLRVGADLAVRDLAALLRFLATPEDDLSLACVLRSPIFGLDERALFSLAHGRDRGEYLWSRLRERAADFAETVSVLADLRDRADFMRPFELLQRVLIRHDGRRRLLARLGPEAEDGIDQLLTQALAYERREPPSLTGFLVWMEVEDIEVKRRPGSGQRAIRVMTVHGAKGLEAPVVILPDTAIGDQREDPRIATDGSGVPVWLAARAADSPQLAAIRAEQAELRRQEQARLLYVAMTRAESWLIVCAAGKTGTGTQSWYSLIEDGMRGAGAASAGPDGLPFGFGRGLRLEHGSWPEPQPAGPTGAAAPATVPPDWALRPAPAAPARQTAASPSDLGGAKALPGQEGRDEEAALRFGSALHLLLEHLPAIDPADHATAAVNLLGGPDGLDAAEIEAALDAAHRVLGSATMRDLCRAPGLVEVELTGSLDALGGRTVRGTIDRLIVDPDRVLAIDYKSNAIVPARPEDVPEGILRQMGAYAALLAQIYPDRRVETAILWTTDATLMPLPSGLTAAALAAAAP